MFVKFPRADFMVSFKLAIKSAGNQTHDPFKNSWVLNY